MTLREAIDGIKEIIATMEHYSRAGSVMHWDQTTSGGACPGGVADRSATIGFLAGESFKLGVSPRMGECLDVVGANTSQLTVNDAAMYRVARRAFDKFKAVPPEEVAEFAQLRGESEAAWHDAKPKGDYSVMKPYFERIFAFQRKLSGYYGKFDHVYDGLLDDYEEGSTVATLDGFFGGLRSEIAPLLAKITEKGKQPDTEFLKGFFDRGRQAMLTQSLSSLIGLDMNRLRIGETEHPFQMTISRSDMRFATNYHEDDLLSAVYSTIHEGGHALYEQGMDAALHPFGLDNAASMAFHESQSRFFENMVGRSRAFAPHLLARLKMLWPAEFSGVDEDMLYKAVNVARPSLIRIESDELTYCLHICVRYESEKEIAEDKIDLDDLPRLWNHKYTELLGVTPQNNTEGVLQDTHWPSGLLGYFPSYAVGNAIAAQLAATMRKTLDVDACIAAGDFAAIRDWMRDNVHSKGDLLKPDELLLHITGEPLNVKHYTDYLTRKFSELYGL